MTTIISSAKHTHKPGSLVNIAVIAALLLAAVPAVIFGIMQILPPLDTSVKTAAVDSAPHRSTAAERRARRRAERRAEKKEHQTATAETYTISTTPEMNGFAPDMNAFGNGFTPDMNGFGGGFGGGFAPDMNGFGGGFGPGMNGFGGGFGGGFGPGMGGFGGFGDIGEFPGDRV